MTSPDAPRPLRVADAKHDLLWAWFAANPNQPMPEGRAAVERRIALIEAEAAATHYPGDDTCPACDATLDAARSASPDPDLAAALLRASAQAVVNQAEPDEGFEGEFVDYLVPFPAIDALRAALAEPAPTLDTPEPPSGPPLIVGVEQASEFDTCLPSALSTITGLAVPDFGHGPTWWNDHVLWLRERGWVLADDDGTRPQPGFSVAIGSSPTIPDANHAAVALDGIVMWDPSPHRDDPGRAFRPVSYWPVFRIASGRPIYDPFAGDTPEPPSLDFATFAATNRARCEAPDGFGHPLNGWSLSDWMLAATGEFGEAANVAKKLNRVRDGIPGNTQTPDELRAALADEFADAVIYLDLAAQASGFSLGDAIVSKFNRTSEKIGAPHRLATPEGTDR